MKAVFDTNILIDFLNGVEAAAKEIALYDDRAIKRSLIKPSAFVASSD